MSTEQGKGRLYKALGVSRVRYRGHWMEQVLVPVAEATGCGEFSR